MPRPPPCHPAGRVTQKVAINKFPDMFNTFRWQKPKKPEKPEKPAKLSGLCQAQLKDKSSTRTGCGGRDKLCVNSIFHLPFTILFWRLVSPWRGVAGCFIVGIVMRPIKTFYNTLWPSENLTNGSLQRGQLKVPLLLASLPLTLPPISALPWHCVLIRNA